ncbi:tetratricopeptide repeat protein [Afipia sp. GAS231]|uniref:tetratricopeptide repeat protein n=1 Tax=Afipia sp. GAS231 TaxID=1882747 RepID=UPI00352BCDC6
MARANAAYTSGDFVKAVNALAPLALRGNPKAQAILGFMYENGFGAPQAYDAAAKLYMQAAIRGNPFAQRMLGLMYDKGHGVPQDFVLAYKWLNLAAAHAPKRDRDYSLRLRNAVASKMSPDQIAEGQRLAMLWAPGWR